jgi:hypothetical protein
MRGRRLSLAFVSLRIRLSPLPSTGSQGPLRRREIKVTRCGAARLEKTGLIPSWNVVMFLVADML